MRANQLICGRWQRLEPDLERFYDFECGGEVVRAALMFHPFRLETEKGWEHGSIGDWLIINVHGLMSICHSLQFGCQYRRVKELDG